MLEHAQHILGGLGLLLLGMWLMTDGLRMAAGPSLEHILSRWTASRQRSLLVGIGVTALMQSSSASTVATIGFVNAGILSFERAVWIVFGSNIGTTLTAWLVTLLGFKLKIDAFALPMIGIGALMHLFLRSERPHAIGKALAGFGMLFLGIDILSSGFQDLSTRIDIDALRHGAWLTPLYMVLIGILVTTLTQASIASFALALTAVASGLLSPAEGAAVVIGANIGTTSTALLASLGATANARRLASAHAIFNLVTGAVALLMLPWFIGGLVWLCLGLGIEPEATLLLALFHSAFNIMGVILMWPIEPAMSRFLQQRFRERETHPAKAQFIDRNVASMPDLALHALAHELERLIQQYPLDIQALLHNRLQYGHQTLARQDLLAQIGSFIAEASRQTINKESASRFGLGWRVTHNLSNTEDSLHQLQALLLRLEAEHPAGLPALQDWLHALTARMEHYLQDATQAETFVALYPEYEKTKDALIAAGLGGQIPQSVLATALQTCSSSRRMVEQWLRALHYGRQLLSEPLANADTHTPAETIDPDNGESTPTPAASPDPTTTAEA